MSPRTPGSGSVRSLGILRSVNTPVAFLSPRRSAARRAAGQSSRNLRLLTTSVIQHLRDDPVLLALQVSRRLPLRVRIAAGRGIRAVGLALPRRSVGLPALGAYMAGDTDDALTHIQSDVATRSRLAGELAVQLDRPDLLPASAPAPTRARAAWSLGDLSGAVSILEEGGRESTPHARRLRNEIELLTTGHRLHAPTSEPLYTEPAPREPLRVLHLLTNSLPHTQSGYSLRSHNILTNQRRHGMEPVALTRTGYPVMIGRPWCADEDVVDGVRYSRSLPVRLGTSPEARLDQEVQEAMRLARELRPHVLHATTDYRNALVAQAVSAATGIPWVLEVRGLMEQTWIASHRSDATREIAMESEKVRRIIDVEGGLAREADAVVTLSRTMADVLQARGVDPERLSIVPNGVDPELLEMTLSTQQARDQIAEALLGPEDLVVGAVSALVDYEGHDDLLRAVALLLADETVPAAVRQRVRVALVGDGVSAPSLRAVAEELGISDRLVMPGRVGRNEARAWVQALDVVVVPRKDLEVTRAVTPQKPAEAMALGRPVIASDLPALRETLTGPDEEELGILVPADSPKDLASALCRLLADATERRRLERSGLDAARSRTWPALMKVYELAYRASVTNSSERCRSGE